MYLHCDQCNFLEKIAKEEDHRNNIEICRDVNLPKSVAVEMQV